MSLEELKQLALGFFLLHGIAEASEASGWLPYRTVPFEQHFLDCGGDIEALTNRVSSYYENHGEVITRDVESALPGYGVDAEAKATLAEALKAHGCELYRSSCRVLLPEIERVIREDWLNIKDLQPLSQKALIKKTEQYHLEDFVHGSGDLVLFGRIFDHLFVRFDGVQPADAHAAPNRHAATHGWAIYSSQQDSLNTIVCADYVFRMVTSFNERKGASP